MRSSLIFPFFKPTDKNFLFPSSHANPWESVPQRNWSPSLYSFSAGRARASPRIFLIWEIKVGSGSESCRLEMLDLIKDFWDIYQLLINGKTESKLRAAEPRQQLLSSDSGLDWEKKSSNLPLQSFCLSLEQGQVEMKWKYLSLKRPPCGFANKHMSSHPVGEKDHNQQGLGCRKVWRKSFFLRMAKWMCRRRNYRRS